MRVSNLRKAVKRLLRATKPVAVTLRQSADIINDDIDGECTEVRRMANELIRARRQVRAELKKEKTGANTK